MKRHWYYFCSVPALSAVFMFFAALFCPGCSAGKFDGGAGGPEQVGQGLDVGRSEIAVPPVIVHVSSTQPVAPGPGMLVVARTEKETVLAIPQPAVVESHYKISPATSHGDKYIGARVASWVPPGPNSVAETMANHKSKEIDKPLPAVSIDKAGNVHAGQGGGTERTEDGEGWLTTKWKHLKEWIAGFGELGLILGIGIVAILVLAPMFPSIAILQKLKAMLVAIWNWVHKALDWILEKLFNHKQPPPAAPPAAAS